MDPDPVKPDQHEESLVAERSHLIWSTYLEKARGQTGIVDSCVYVENIIGPTPAFPRGWVQHIEKGQARKYPNGSELFISGRGYWQDVRGSCQLDPKTLEKNLLVGIQKPCRFELIEDGRFQEWPGIAYHSCPVKGNYLAMLVFAWAYIFSAEWIELHTNSQPPQGKIEYLVSEIEDSTGYPLEIEMEQADHGALEWWRAIVCPGQGWKATVTFDGIEYQSPWSVSVSGVPRIQIREHFAPPNKLRQTRAPCFKTSLGFLIDFCETYDLYDQCMAALSVAILIPTVKGCVNQLPLPKVYHPKRHPRNFNKGLWDQAARIPYYMSIGSNTRGPVALLSATFFNASIACNFVSAWLDPIFKILDSLRRQNEYITFLNMLSLREPNLAPLWLGALIIGFESSSLRTARVGTPIVDLVATAWTGVDMSFITAKDIQRTASDSVQRADECRLLFFLNCPRYEQPPICPWRPFGSVPLEQAEVQVRAHSSCCHDFKYCGWRWDLSKGSSSLDTGYRVQSRERRDELEPRELKVMVVKVSSSLASETATRSIFGWLRSDGWAENENNIWNHIWFIGYGDDNSLIEESEGGDGDDNSLEQGDN